MYIMNSTEGLLSQVFVPTAGGVTAAKGFRAAGVHAGLKRKRKDVALVVSDRPASVAGTFTTNQVKAAPVHLTRRHVESGTARAIVVNSGNANACTGPQGMADALRMAEFTAELVGAQAGEVLVASTGVIGVPLPMDTIEAGIAAAFKRLDTSGGDDAAEAIMTTDTRPKQFAVECQIDGKRVIVGGMAKGSGMIHPNMATMLAFITTDAAVQPAFLQTVLSRVVDETFNMISVDGDTSTNDMVLVMANGMAENEVIHPGSSAAAIFEEALATVCLYLAKEIVRDGEGATKLIEVHVSGAPTVQAARTIARSISTSNLVKTAMYGEDANWGRILCAAGYSGVEFDPEGVTIHLGDVCVAKDGGSIPFDEAKASEVLREPEVHISVDLQAGEYQATAWTCDMTYDYVKINASYRS